MSEGAPDGSAGELQARSLLMRLPNWMRVGFILLFPLSIPYGVYRMWRTKRFSLPVRVAATVAALVLFLAFGPPSWSSKTEPPRTASSTSTAANTSTPATPAATTSPAPAAEPTPSVQASEATVVRVVDGDTIVVNLEGREEKVRFIGVNTPEISGQVERYGKEAAAYTTKELAGKTVFLETDVQLRDKYGRILAYVWLQRPEQVNGAEIRTKMFNAVLLLAGYANLMTIPPDVRYVDYFKPMESEARAANAGLWAPAPAPAPKPAPKPSPKPAPTPAPEGSGQSYVGSVNSDVFHYPWCSSAKRIKSSNLVEFSSRQDALDHGYRPCKNCNP